MTTETSTKQERIKKAFVLARVQKPAYAEYYPLLEPLFLLQEEVKAEVSLKAVEVPSDAAAEQLSNGFPLLKRWDFPVDVRSAGAILDAMESLIPSDNRAMTSAWSALSRSLAKHAGFEASFWESFLQPDLSAWEEWAKGEGGIDFASILFIARSCLRPSIEKTAEDLTSKCDGFPLWHRGRCPVCGSFPSLLFLVGDGERKAYCSWCATPWGIERFQCPGCENRDHTKLGYLYIEEEPQYRIQYCEACKAYFKQIDARERIEEPFFPLEEWISLHLDLIAHRAGWVEQS